MIDQLDDEIENFIQGFERLSVSKNSKMTPADIQALMTGAVQSALETQQRIYNQRLEELSQKIDNVSLKAEVETYEEVQIVDGKKCDESLDVIKSIPEFEGKPETYVSWRQAAHTAYKIFEKYDGSSKHYQAVAVLRNKIRGPADAVLASFNTVLNFNAIIARLDFTYADKRPVYLIEQELSTLRQGKLSLLQYYDEVEKKLTLLTNKTIMTYESALASSMNQKYRMDALRVFVSGLRKSLSDVLFSARPTDLPSALALAQEIEANHERYVFATSFARNSEDRAHTGNDYQGKSPYFSKNPGIQTVKQVQQNPNRRDQVVPMEVDPTSSKFRQTTNFQPRNTNQWQPPPNRHWQPPNNYQTRGPIKRTNASERESGRQKQRINHLSQENGPDSQDEFEYNQIAESEASEIGDETSGSDSINFLGGTPCYRSYNGQSQGKQ